VEIYGRVRRAVRVEGRSQRAVAREFGFSRETVRKMLQYAVSVVSAKIGVAIAPCSGAVPRAAARSSGRGRCVSISHCVTGFAKSRAGPKGLALWLLNLLTLSSARPLYPASRCARASNRVLHRNTVLLAGRLAYRTRVRRLG
jgi:hypothetical protein